MEAVFSRQRMALAIAAFVTGIIVYWLTQNPLGLVAPIATLYFYARGRTALLFHAALLAGFVGALLVAAFYTGAMRDLAVAWAAFFAVALCVGGIVAISASASSDAEAMPAAIRATSRNVTPSYPVLGPTLPEKSAPRHSPFVSISVQDDKPTAALMRTVSFWGGTHFHMRYWQRQPDGSHRWKEARSEPLRDPDGTRQWSSVVADVDDQRPELQPPTRIASNPQSNGDAVRAAKIVENLLGNAWAFDAAGRPTYLTPLAQTFVAVTLEEFQAVVDEGHTFFKRTTHPDDYDRVSAAWRQSLQTGDPFFLDRRIRRASGIHEWNRTGFVATRDGQGRITGWYGATIDLDAHRIAEAELRDREREFSQLVAMVPSHIWRLTPDGEPVFFNKRMVDFLGLDVADTDKPGMSRLEVLIESIHPADTAAFRGVLNRCLTAGESFAMRYRLRRADGVYHWMSSRAEPMRDESGRIVEWYGLCHDIDDQVQSEELLRRNEQQLQQLVETLPALIYCAAPNGEPTYRSRQLREYLGFNVQDKKGPDGSHLAGTLDAVIHPDELAAVKKRYAHSLSTGEPYVMKHRLRRVDGEYRWVETRAATMRNVEGEIVQWNAICLDVDDEVHAQEALRERERELSQFVNMVPVLLWRLTPAGEPTFFNKRLIDFLGLDSTDPEKPEMSRLATAMTTALHPDDAAGFAEALDHSLVTGKPFSRKYRLRRADGVYRWLEGRIEPLRDQDEAVLQWYAVSIDIDDEVHAQAALRESEHSLREREAKIRRLVDSDIIGIVIWDLDGRLIDANDAFLRMLQYEREDLQAGLRWFDMTPPEWQDVHAQYEAEELMATGKMQAREKEYFRKDGSRVPVMIGAACFEGDSRQGVAYILDLTERKRAESALQDRERELAQLVDMVPVYIRRLTPEGEPVFFNKRLTDFIGVGVAEVGTPGMSRLPPAVEDFVHPDEAGGLLATIRHSLATGEGYARKYRMRRTDGVYRWLETRAEPVRNHDGTIMQWYIVSIDVDDEVRAQEAEEALRQASDKLTRAAQAASLAELSASIAHEVNQPLAAVVANSHACQRWLKSDPPNLERAQTTVERIIRDANSAADVVSRIRALFRQSVEPRRPAEFHSVIVEARNLMAEEAVRRRVRMDVDVENNLPLVAFDRVQIQQVLINLIRNGMDAIDATATDRVLGIRVRRTGDMVQTEISDRGSGIEFPEKIFEPFFTTKEHGMGMGLAICRSIVESHGGRLWAEKNEPQGSTFIFTLPVEVKTVP